jgi:hypothetical protein
MFAFKCTCCGEIHEGSPSIGYRMPDQYACLSDEQREAMGTIDSDLCTITHAEGTDYFIRAVLEVPIHGVDDPFLWGGLGVAEREEFQALRRDLPGASRR